MSVQAYTAAFTELAYQITDMDNNEKFHTYRAGLKPHIRQEMDRQRIFEDLHLLQDAAQRFDELYFEYKKPSNFKNQTYKRFNDNRRVHAIEDKKDTSSITCFKCQKLGHYAKDYRTNPNKFQAKKNPSKKGSTPIKDKRTVNTIIVKTAKTSPSTKLPEYKTSGSAGADLTPSESGTLFKFQTKKIPTGIRAEIPKGYYGQILARSSVQQKGISITGVIDSDYRGEIFLIVTNHNPYSMEYSNTGKAIAQLIIIPCEQPNVQEAQELSSTNRKGGFGSTNVDTISSHPGKLVFKGTIKGKTLHFIIDSGADGIFAGQNMIEK